MNIEVYRKYTIGSIVIVDNEPETVFRSVDWFTIKNGTIYGNMNGEELTIHMDMYNYNYRFSA